MSEWKLEVTCPKGHNEKIGLYFDEGAYKFHCATCNNWWEPLEEELNKNGVTLI